MGPVSGSYDRSPQRLSLIRFEEPKEVEELACVRERLATGAGHCLATNGRAGHQTDAPQLGLPFAASFAVTPEDQNNRHAIGRTLQDSRPVQSLQ
jgi:hypothetical protein